jgi:long-chain acyl-CoA synthetase
VGASVYDERPWLSRYAEGQPADIEPDHPSALAMFDATVLRAPDAVAIHYRDSALTFA